MHLYLGYLQKSGHVEFWGGWNLANLGQISFHEKSFCIQLEILFLRWNFGENSPVKETAGELGKRKGNSDNGGQGEGVTPFTYGHSMWDLT